jgi:hypothetical protein
MPCLDRNSESVTIDNILVTKSRQGGDKLNIVGIISDLKTERERIDRAIVALEGLSANGASSGSASKRAASHTPKRRHLSAQGRKRLSDLMKKRWAERRKKAGAKS